MTDPGGRRRVAGLLVLLAVGVAAWVLRDDLRGMWADDAAPVDGPPAETPAVGPGTGSGGSPAGGDRTGRAGEGDGDAAGTPAGTGASADGPDDRGRERAAAGEVDGREETTPSPAFREPTADPAQRLRKLFGPGGSGEVRLDSADLAMLLGPGRTRPLPPGVSDPRAVPRDSVLEASADVDLDRVLGERLPALVRRMIGDSARVRAVMTPEVPVEGVLRVRVRSVQAGSMTFPPGMVPWLLRQMGLPTAEDDPAAVELRPGSGLTGARVEDGALVLARQPPG